MLQKLRCIFLMFVCFIFPAKNFASHIIGGYINYTYLSSNTYLVRFVFLRECSNAPLDTVMFICYQSQSCGFAGLDSLTLVSLNVRPDNPCEGSLISTCLGGTAYGIEEGIFEDTLTLPFQCSDWKFAWTSCCRTQAIVNLNNGSGEGLFINASLDNLNFPTNSSPQFNQTIFNSYCINMPTSIPFSCIDVDGDSIVYELSDALAGAGVCNPTYQPVVYTLPYTGSIPFSSSTLIYFDQQTGDLNSVPNQIGIYVLSLKIKEYRNGVLIDSLSRDDNIAFVAGLQNPDFINGNVFHDANNNGIKDPGEKGLQNKFIETSPNHFYASSKANGNFSMTVPLDTFDVTVQNLNPLFISPQSYNIPFAVAGQTSSNNNFAYYVAPGIKELEVTLMASPKITLSGYNSYFIYYSNNGSDTIYNPSIQLIMDTAFTYLFSNPIPTTINSDTLIWNLPSLSPLQFGLIHAVALSYNPLQTGQLLHSSVTIFPVIGDSIPSNNEDTVTQEVVASFDPNIKEVSPSGDVSQQFVANSNYLTYTIHFQNTGTSTAQNIWVYDVLDSALDLSTLEFLSSSHSCYMDVSNLASNRLINFTFSNINLQDSAQNEPASHGYLKYRIKPFTTTPVGSSITNSANIFFDANALVATNTVVTNVTLAASLQDHSIIKNDFKIFPNPSNSNVTISCDEINNGEIKFSIFNALGVKVFQQSVILTDHKLKRQFNVSELPSGFYVFRIETTTNVLTHRFIKL